jgi:endonuclease YncB( thermonuclease family)
MLPVLHQNPEDYEAEYRRVRAALIEQGTTLNQWLLKNGINRQLAYLALRGQSFGTKSRALRARILREVFGEAR